MTPHPVPAGPAAAASSSAAAGEPAHEHRGNVPDPGRDEAVRLLLAHFGDARHRRGGRSREDMLPGDQPRECLGCSIVGPAEPGYQCFGGPTLYAYCEHPGCHAHGWEYRLSWEAFDRLRAPLDAGQTELFETR